MTVSFVLPPACANIPDTGNRWRPPASASGTLHPRTSNRLRDCTKTRSRKRSRRGGAGLCFSGLGFLSDLSSIQAGFGGRINPGFIRKQFIIRRKSEIKDLARGNLEGN
jgi:hypothetical protein